MTDQDTAGFYRAMLARDRRYDGRFFVGVRTTGIYCRPICPARKPLLKNVRFFATSAAAELAGFRPCQRCRPESAPGTPAWKGPSATVERGLRLIRMGAAGESVEDLARKLGVGERRLRQLFAEHVGVSPGALTLVHRLDFARRLIDESHLPITEIAFRSGFESVRRFNEAVRHRFGRSPRELRKASGPRAPIGDTLTLRLSFRPPFDWRGLLEFLDGRAIPGVEKVEGNVYHRTISLGAARGVLRAECDLQNAQLVVSLSPIPGAHLMEAVERARALFDLDADPLRIAAHLGRQPDLRTAVKSFPGLRVPGGWDGFELAVRGILGQQVSVKGARTLAGRIVAAFGTPVSKEGSGLTHYFPSATAIAQADLERLGIFRQRARALRALAAEVAAGRITLDGSANRDATLQALLALPGVGPWTAQYIAMRALRAPDAFPDTDLVLRRAIKNRKRTEAWSPWRAYATMYLWRST